MLCLEVIFPLSTARSFTEKEKIFCRACATDTEMGQSEGDKKELIAM